MRSALPKVLHPLLGRELVLWPVQAAQAAGARQVVVVGGADRALSGKLPAGVELGVQEEPLGTGDAVRSAEKWIGDQDTVVVLSGDVPLVSDELISALADEHEESGAAATMVTVELDDPTGYGRVVRDASGALERVVETKADGDAKPQELAIKEINTGIYAFTGAPLLEALSTLGADNAQGEYYLPEVLPSIRAAGGKVGTFTAQDPALVLGVNDLVDLATVAAVAQRRICDAHMRAGVTILDPSRVLIEPSVQIGQDAVISPGAALHGATTVGSGSEIGPNTTLIDTTVGAGSKLIQTYSTEATVGDGCNVGPFAYLRPGAVLGDSSKVGTYVEIKNSTIGVGSKVPHLSYVGDTDIGESTNLGAGTITANYDGVNKHRTMIGSNVHGGVDTSLVAPVTVGDNVWIAAGSVITEDVPDGALAVARSRQTNIDDYNSRKHRESKG